MPSRPSLILALLAGCNYLGPGSLDRDGDGVLDPSDCDFLGDDAATRSQIVSGYRDSDGDGFGAGELSEFCHALPEEGWADNDDDCNDEDREVSPDTLERCDTPGVDDDCNGLVDGSDDGVIIGALPMLPDFDEDGVGDMAALLTAPQRCEAELRHVLYASGPLDCDDSDPEVHEGREEVCDNKDQDCDGVLDEGFAVLAWYEDADADTYGIEPAIQSCGPPLEGWVTFAGDCDDANASINPSQVEACNGVDDDCDGSIDDQQEFLSWFPDGDGDGYGTGPGESACQQPSPGHVLFGDDCDDLLVSVHPGAPELCNGLDDDCDDVPDDGLLFELWYTDEDGDGYGLTAGLVSACAQPPSTSPVGGDCLDSGPRADESFPGAVEVPYDDVDQDCDGFDLIDVDGDGVDSPLDCDDDDATISPLAGEIWYDGIDQDCDGLADDRDQDGDGFPDPVDCNDLDGSVNPAAFDDPTDDWDNDCDGFVSVSCYVDADDDGFGTGNAIARDLDACPAGEVETSGDCDDLDGNRNPGAVEYCDGIDDNCDGGADHGLVTVTAVDGTRANADPTQVAANGAAWIDVCGYPPGTGPMPLHVLASVGMDETVVIQGGFVADDGVTVSAPSTGLVETTGLGSSEVRDLVVRGGTFDTVFDLQASGGGRVSDVTVDSVTATLGLGLGGISDITDLAVLDSTIGHLMEGVGQDPLDPQSVTVRDLTTRTFTGALYRRIEALAVFGWTGTDLGRASDVVTTPVDTSLFLQEVYLDRVVARDLIHVSGSATVIDLRVNNSNLRSVLYDQGAVTVANTSLQGNDLTLAPFVNEGGLTVVNGSLFYNYGDQSGGVLQLAGSLFMQGMTFLQNESGSRGGSVHIQGGNGTVIDTDHYGSMALAGGAIAVGAYGNLTLAGTTLFVNNVANSGNALFVEGRLSNAGMIEDRGNVYGDTTFGGLLFARGEVDLGDVETYGYDALAGPRIVAAAGSFIQIHMLADGTAQNYGSLVLVQNGGEIDAYGICQLSPHVIEYGASGEFQLTSTATECDFYGVFVPNLPGYFEGLSCDYSGCTCIDC